jgi:hypothetical protein
MTRSVGREEAEGRSRVQLEGQAWGRGEPRWVYRGHRARAEVCWSHGSRRRRRKRKEGCSSTLRNERVLVSLARTSAWTTLEWNMYAMLCSIAKESSPGLILDEGDIDALLRTREPREVQLVASIHLTTHRQYRWDRRGRTGLTR